MRLRAAALHILFFVLANAIIPIAIENRGFDFTKECGGDAASTPQLLRHKKVASNSELFEAVGVCNMFACYR